MSTKGDERIGGKEDRGHPLAIEKINPDKSTYNGSRIY